MDRIREAWCSILNVDRSIVNDSSTFFDFGGSPLSFVHLFNWYQSDLIPNHNLNAHEFIDNSTFLDHINLLRINKNQQSDQNDKGSIRNIYLHVIKSGNTLNISHRVILV